MTHYEIKILGHLATHWSDWFDGLDISHDPDDNTILAGIIPDQAALHGLLAKVRDMGLSLISVTSTNIENKNKKERNNDNITNNA